MIWNPGRREVGGAERSPSGLPAFRPPGLPALHPSILPAFQPFSPSPMSLSTVLFLFLAHLGVGIAVTLLFVSRDAGVKFFRFNAGLAAILIAVALAFRHGAF